MTKTPQILECKGSFLLASEFRNGGSAASLPTWHLYRYDYKQTAPLNLVLQFLFTLRFVKTRISVAC